MVATSKLLREYGIKNIMLDIMRRLHLSLILVEVIMFLILTAGASHSFSEEDYFKKTFIVKSSSYEMHNMTWLSEQPLHITFDVRDGVVDFLVVNEEDLLKIVRNETLHLTYYTLPSDFQISTLDIEWQPPENKNIFFVWDNSLSTDAKAIRARLYTLEYEPLVPRVVSYSSVLVMTVVLPIAFLFDISRRSKTRNGVKGSEVLLMSLVFALIFLGFIDGVIMKESTLSSVTNETIFGSIVAWVIMSSVWMIARRDPFEESDNDSEGYAIWPGFFGVVFIEPIGDVSGTLFYFVITACVWAIPFLLIYFFVPWI